MKKIQHMTMSILEIFRMKVPLDFGIHFAKQRDLMRVELQAQRPAGIFSVTYAFSVDRTRFLKYRKERPPIKSRH